MRIKQGFWGLTHRECSINVALTMKGGRDAPNLKGIGVQREKLTWNTRERQRWSRTQSEELLKNLETDKEFGGLGL